MEFDRAAAAAAVFGGPTAAGFSGPTADQQQQLQWQQQQYVGQQAAEAVGASVQHILNRFNKVLTPQQVQLVQERQHWAAQNPVLLDVYIGGLLQALGLPFTENVVMADGTQPV